MMTRQIEISSRTLKHATGGRLGAIWYVSTMIALATEEQHANRQWMSEVVLKIASACVKCFVDTNPNQHE